MAALDASPAIRVRNLSKQYPGGPLAMRDVSLDVPRGQFVAVIGLSGAGKSTFLRSLNRLVDPTSGTIHINGVDVTAARGRELRHIRRRIGIIFQQFNLVRRLSVEQNVLSGRLGYQSGWRAAVPAFTHEDRVVAVQALERVGLGERRFARADALSGGQQQRVAIARALAQNPEIMLADEPVASLDPETSKTVLGYLRQVNQEDGITTLVNLHQLDYAREYADRIVGFREGRIVFDGTPDAVTDDVYNLVYVRAADQL
ncbi:MAG: phosphonate ABC transporter ATP-binding protein [Thermomicrobiales bacterium]